MQEINKKNIIEKITKNWNAIKNAIIGCASLMKDIDYDDSRVISYNAIMPIIYYLYKGGKFKKDDYSRNELRKYFAICFAKGLFGGSSDTAITNACNVIISDLKKFNVSLFKNTEFSGGRNFKVDIDLINKWLNTLKKGNKTYPILMLLSPNLLLLENGYDQDHSHADCLFNDSKFSLNEVPEERRSLWKNSRSLIPNLSFMLNKRNKSKNKTDLKTWLENNPDKRDSIVLLPSDISYEFKNYEQYFTLRRSMMKYQLCKIFSVNREQIKIDDYVTLNVSDPTQSLVKGMHGKVLSLGNNNNASVEFIDSDGSAKFIKTVNLDVLYIVEDFTKNYNEET